ncbi:MAG: hypothetical protein HOM96_02605 [Rickettsiales bacterium]|jgi:endonuclease YncB( thermonuclease family)|nr:hypothetical protein [Rickettsiales bacterium]
MKNVVHISLVSFATFVTLSSNALSFNPTECKHDIDKLSCAQYVSNYDGDSLVFNILDAHPLLGSKLKFELSEVKTAKIRAKDKCEKAKAKKAKKLVSNIVKSSSRIDLVNIEKTKSGRLKGDVLVDQQSLSDKLLKENLAIAVGTKKHNWCK